MKRKGDLPFSLQKGQTERLAFCRIQVFQHIRLDVETDDLTIN